MKRKFLGFGICLLSLSIVSCDNTSSSSTGSDTTNSSEMGDTMNTGSNSATNNTGTMSGTPLTKDDSTFVMEAAVGGLMEVESGNIAQQNAAHDRVKAFGAMMVKDHGKANDELKSLASSRGMTLPASLPADKQKHVDDMRKMTGKSFDQHYIGMMDTDHSKTIDLFKKQAEGGGDAELKAWAAKTLPVLQAHKDSVQAIKKAKM